MTDHLLPPNASTPERALSGALSRLGGVLPAVRDVWNPETCPRELLPWLAWALSVDEWDGSWTEAQQRATIQQSVTVHKYKGTIGAVKDALAALGIRATVQEWFSLQPAGDPYTFAVNLDASEAGADEAAVSALGRVIDRAKNLRSHLRQIEVSVTSPAGPTVAAYTCLGSEIVVTNYVPAPLVINENALCF